MKNTHLEHIEDEILNRGSKGGRDVIDFLEDIGKFLHQRPNEVNITTKWDGAPAIICGTDPETKKFFVGTKSVFNKTNAKVCYSNGDIDNYYTGQLASKLKACLRHLPKLDIKGVVQGDLLFTNDKKILSIGGDRVISFTPNTITYTIPVGSSLSKKVSKAVLGIVFHTEYSGDSLSSMDAKFGFRQNIKDHKDIFVPSANFTDSVGTSRFSAIDRTKFASLVSRSRGSLKQASIFLDAIQKSDYAMPTIFKRFFNSYVREGKKLNSATAVVNDFSRYYAAVLDKEVSSKKSKLGKDKYIRIKTLGLRFIEKNQRSIYMTIASHMNITQAKNFIIRRLERAKSIGTFVRINNGYKVTTPEGFVAIKNGHAIKLVDRFEFSRNNFTVAKNWDKK